MKNLARAKELGLASLVWVNDKKHPDVQVAAAAWPYVGYGQTEDEALAALIRNIEEKKEYNG